MCGCHGFASQNQIHSHAWMPENWVLSFKASFEKFLDASLGAHFLCVQIINFN